MDVRIPLYASVQLSAGYNHLFVITLHHKLLFIVILNQIMKASLFFSCLSQFHSQLLNVL